MHPSYHTVSMETNYSPMLPFTALLLSRCRQNVFPCNLLRNNKAYCLVVNIFESNYYQSFVRRNNQLDFRLKLRCSQTRIKPAEASSVNWT